MTKYTLTLFVAGLFIASCGGDDDVAAPTNVPTDTAQASETATPAPPTATATANADVSPTKAAVPTPTPERATTAKFSGADTCLNIRDEPSTIGEIIGCSADGMTLNIWGGIEYGFGYDWLAVETDTGEQGWAATDFLEFDRGGFPAEYSVPVHPADTRTGVATVDGLIAAVHAGNAKALARNISSITIGCIIEPVGIGGPPFCKDDEPEGTELEVLPSAQCEGYYARVEEIGDSFFELVRGAPRIFAVFEVAVHDPDPMWPLGDYEVVFALASGGARTVRVDSGGIVNVWYGCDGDAFTHADRGETFLLDPPAR